MINTTTHNSICTITLARPDKRNALTPEMLHDLLDAVRIATSDANVRTILLAGEGRVFCAGFDLTRCRNDNTVLPELLQGLSQAAAALRTAPQPVVVAAHGAAIAGGCALLGGCDVVVAEHNAKLGYPVVRLGISPAVSAPGMVAAMGSARTRERFLSGELITGTEGERIGLVHELVEEREETHARAVEIATELAAKPPAAVQATKQLLSDLDNTADPALHERALATSMALLDAGESDRRLRQLWNRG